LQSGVPGNPGQDPAAQFGTIVKRELVAGPSFAGEQFVGSALAFHAPADALQGSQDPALVGLIQFGKQLSEGEVNYLPTQLQGDGISGKKLYVALLE